MVTVVTPSSNPGAKHGAHSVYRGRSSHELESVPISVSVSQVFRGRRVHDSKHEITWRFCYEGAARYTSEIQEVVFCHSTVSGKRWIRHNGELILDHTSMGKRVLGWFVGRPTRHTWCVSYEARTANERARSFRYSSGTGLSSSASAASEEETTEKERRKGRGDEAVAAVARLRAARSEAALAAGSAAHCSAAAIVAAAERARRRLSSSSSAAASTAAKEGKAVASHNASSGSSGSSLSLSLSGLGVTAVDGTEYDEGEACEQRLLRACDEEERRAGEGGVEGGEGEGEGGEGSGEEPAGHKLQITITETHDRFMYELVIDGHRFSQLPSRPLPRFENDEERPAEVRRRIRLRRARLDQRERRRRQQRVRRDRGRREREEREGLQHDGEQEGLAEPRLRRKKSSFFRTRVVTGVGVGEAEVEAEVEVEAAEEEDAEGEGVVETGAESTVEADE